MPLTATSDLNQDSRLPASQANALQPASDAQPGREQNSLGDDLGFETSGDDGTMPNTRTDTQSVGATAERSGATSSDLRSPSDTMMLSQIKEPRSDQSVEFLSERPARHEAITYTQSDDRRKRRKTTPPQEPDTLPVRDTKKEPKVAESESQSISSPRSRDAAHQLDTQPVGTKLQGSSGFKNDLPQEASEPADGTQSPPKKVIKLRGDGKLASPKLKGSPVKEPTEKKKRGRKPKATPSPESKSKVAVMRYSTDGMDSQTSVGESIDSILSGSTRARPPLAEKNTQLKAKPKPVGPPKPMHPLFRSKAEKEAEKVAEKAAEEAARLEAEKKRIPVRTTPRKRAFARVGPSPTKKASRRASSNSLSDNERPKLSFGGPLRQAGAWALPWPLKGATHVRGLDGHEAALLQAQVQHALPSRKLKLSKPRVPENESILRLRTSAISSLARRTRHLGLSASDTGSGFHAPQRLLLSGHGLQVALLKQLRIGDVSIQEQLLQKGKSALASDGRRLLEHPAVVHLFDKAGTALSAFDNFQCEDVEWVHKYAPKTLAHTLQPAHRLEPLRAWLQGLVVNSTNCVNNAAKVGRPAKRRKKRKRSSDLDDFVVSGDDDEVDDEGASDSEDVAQYNKSHKHATQQQASLQKLTSSGRSSTKAVLLSGRHGCGKTASVYAIAQELGFEVFEINPGTRRAGRDILDKIGDMTKNHLVNRQSGPMDADEREEESADMSQHVQEEIDSGRQSTMNAFFKAAPPKKPGPKAKKGGKKRQSDSPKQKQDKQPNRSQKQSLILLEEVDVLFDEDRGFWATVADLVRDSRRPVIMTCTDETLIPAADLESLSVLRLIPPPTDLATDYLLLLAACEGHLLDRSAVHALYRTRSMDLRASIKDLNFWCQMALGDPKRGLGWMLLRSNPAECQNAQGEPLRVISDRTFSRHMGLLPSMESNMHPSSVDAEVAVLSDVLDSRHFDVDEWLAGAERSAAQQPSDLSPMQQYRKLLDVDEAMDLVSLADLVQGEDPCSLTATAVDATAPTMTLAQRLNFTDSLPLLLASPREDLDTTHRDLALSLKVMARNSLSLSQSHSYSTPHQTQSVALPPLDTHALAEVIITPSPTLEQHQSTTLTAMATAFSILAATIEGSTPAASRGPQITVFDGPTAPIATDVAPCVRAIVAFDVCLEQQRLALSNLLSHGGHGGHGGGGKRPRTTRASRAALEGGSKASTRRERWFAKELGVAAVLKTGGEGWQECLRAVLAREKGEGGSAEGSRRSSAADVSTPVSVGE